MNRCCDLPDPEDGMSKVFSVLYSVYKVYKIWNTCCHQEQQIDALFMKIDWASEGSITWDEFCTYMQLEYAEKEDSYLRAKEVAFHTPARIENIPHRDPVLRITDTSDGTFVACSQVSAMLMNFFFGLVCNKTPFFLMPFLDSLPSDVIPQLGQRILSETPNPAWTKIFFQKSSSLSFPWVYNHSVSSHPDQGFLILNRIWCGELYSMNVIYLLPQNLFSSILLLLVELHGQFWVFCSLIHGQYGFDAVKMSSCDLSFLCCHLFAAYGKKVIGHKIH